MPVLAALQWPILERIHLPGGLAISPHGIMIAVGFLAGAQLLLSLARRRGIARKPVEGLDEAVQSLITRAAIGGILGARIFYVATHLDQFSGPLDWLRIWEGGLSLLGSIAGAILLGLPLILRRGYSVPLLLDSAAPAVALGIFIGRIGDLIIGEHLGGQTDFVLGWRCSGAFGDPGAPYPWPGPVVQGCFDTAVHQTAFYDFLAGGIVFAILMLAARRPRFDGFFMAGFAILYGGGRLLSDFAREADRDLVGTLTGSQVAALAAIAASLLWLIVVRPWRREPWAWSPPGFDHGWGVTAPAAPAGDAAAHVEPGAAGAQDAVVVQEAAGADDAVVVPGDAAGPGTTADVPVTSEPRPEAADDPAAPPRG